MPSNQICKNFINEIAPIIQKVAKERGYAICSTVIAQACIESAYGTSSLGYKYHNYFGMKCGSSYKGKSVNMRTKEEYTVGTLTTIRDNFRAYDSMLEGVNGYYDFIQYKRYANLKTADSAQVYAERLKADGYATSSTYVNTLMNTVRKWDLEKYDSGNPVQIINDAPKKKSNEEIAREVMRGLWGDKYTKPTRQERLTSAGYDYYEIQKLVTKILKG